MCNENCIECPKFEHDISRVKLKEKILSDDWFKFLFLYFKTYQDASKLECPEELNILKFNK